MRRTMRELLETPEAKPRLATSGMKPVGAMRELDGGRVRFPD